MIPVIRRLLLSIGILTAVVIGTTAGRWLANEASAENQPGFDYVGLYDTTTPGISTNIPERWCVRDFSTIDPNFTVAQAEAQIASFLSDPDGWTSVGTTKVQFIHAPGCASANVFIDFYDYDDPGFDCPGAACAPYDQSSQAQVIDNHAGHNLLTGMHVAVNWWGPNGSKSTIQHEMGHILGLHHNGPVWGRMGFVFEDGAIHDGPTEPNPTENEIYQARSHLNGEPSPALVPCIGSPAPDRIHVSWFDTAIDDDTNSAAVWWWNGSEWVNIQTPEMTQTEVPDFGGRVSLLSDPIGDMDHLWTARADVVGGYRDKVNWDPAVFAINYLDPRGSEPQATCTVNVQPTSVAGQILITWKDASFNETEFEVWYNFPEPDGSLNSNNWFPAMGCAANTESCTDIATAGNFNIGQRVCVIMRAANSFGDGTWSNVACTQSVGEDTDLDGYKDIVEEGQPLCAGNFNDDQHAFIVDQGEPVPQADDTFINDGCLQIGDQSESGAECNNPWDDDDDGYVNDGCPKQGIWSEGQFNIGTDATERCGIGFDPQASDAWPADFVSGSTPNSTDQINILDLVSFIAPIRRLDTSPGHPDFDPRWDLRPGPSPFSRWINTIDMVALLAPGSPENNPPMEPFYGQPALNSGIQCTDPPS